MKFDFYLSEMSVSNLHGAGLTLQRVLGLDLAQIGCFIHVSRFATDFPVSDQFAAKCFDFPMWAETDSARLLVGCRPSNWLHQRAVLKRGRARRVAAYIHQRFRTNHGAIKGLVCPQTTDSLYCIEAIWHRMSVEYVTWLMDDYFVRWNGTEWVYPKGVEALVSRHLKRAQCVFTISPCMRDFYNSRFGVRCEVLIPPANNCETPVWARPGGDATVRLGYFGALGPWQTDALELLTKRLGRLNAVLDIYTAAQFPPSPLRHPGVRVCQRVAASQLQSTMRAYDALVLPASFAPERRNLSEFNIATKMSEYLASGTLTLLIAPQYASMAKVLRGLNAAVLVNEDSDRSFESAIELIRSAVDRAPVLRSARDYVENSLSVAAMQQVWHRGTCGFGNV